MQALPAEGIATTIEISKRAQCLTVLARRFQQGGTALQCSLAGLTQRRRGRKVMCHHAAEQLRSTAAFLELTQQRHRIGMIGRDEGGTMCEVIAPREKG